MSGLRIVVLVPLLALATAGCAIPRTWEKISPAEEGYRDYVESVTAAYRQDDGSVIVCVTGQRAATGPLVFGRLPVEPFSLRLPVDAAAQVDPGEHASVRRYVPPASAVGGPCPRAEVAGASLPVRIVRCRELGHPAFDRVPEAAMAAVIADQPLEPAILVFMSEGWWRPGNPPDTETEGWWRNDRDPKIVYVDSEPRFNSARAVLIEPGLRPVAGNPLYVAALPAAAALDILTIPVFIVAVVTGVYKG